MIGINVIENPIKEAEYIEEFNNFKKDDDHEVNLESVKAKKYAKIIARMINQVKSGNCCKFYIDDEILGERVRKLIDETSSITDIENVLNICSQSEFFDLTRNVVTENVVAVEDTHSQDYRENGIYVFNAIDYNASRSYFIHEDNRMMTYSIKTTLDGLKRTSTAIYEFGEDGLYCYDSTSNTLCKFSNEELKDFFIDKTLTLEEAKEKLTSPNFGSDILHYGLGKELIATNVLKLDGNIEQTMNRIFKQGIRNYAFAHREELAITKVDKEQIYALNSFESEKHVQKRQEIAQKAKQRMEQEQKEQEEAKRLEDIRFNAFSETMKFRDSSLLGKLKINFAKKRTLTYGLNFTKNSKVGKIYTELTPITVLYGEVDGEKYKYYSNELERMLSEPKTAGEEEPKSK